MPRSRCTTRSGCASRPATSRRALAQQNGIIGLLARGDDLPARETGMLLSANGSGRLEVELATDLVGGDGCARDVVLLLGDGSEASLRLTGSRLAGQRGEAFYAV